MLFASRHWPARTRLRLPQSVDSSSSLSFRRVSCRFSEFRSGGAPHQLSAHPYSLLCFGASSEGRADLRRAFGVLYRRNDESIDEDTSRVSPRRFRSHQIEPPHLAVQIRALDAEHTRRFRNAAMLMLQNSSDVVALKLSACLPQRRVESGRTDASLQLRVSEDILQTNEPLRHQQHEPLEEPTQFWRVPSPRKC